MNKRQVILIAPCSSDTELVILSNPILDEDKVKIINAYDSDNIVNLKDVSIVLCSMVGSGVVDQLAKELANRLGLGNFWRFFRNKLISIFREYSKLSQEESEERWFDATQDK